MMIVMRLWLILSVSAAAPLNSNVHKESVEENLVSDDIGSVDIVEGDDMDGDGLHSHSSQDTGRDAKLVFTGGAVSIGNIGDIHAQVRIASIMSNIDPHDEPAPDPVCPADVAVTTDCMCAGISCATGSTCVGGSTCTTVCPADVAVTKDCMCAGISCATGSTCVGGSTCTAVCNADEVNVDACFCENAGEGEHCTAGQFCNSDGTCFDEKLWRDDGRCGDNYPLPNGEPGQCDPTANEDEKGPCCSDNGWCGNSDKHCKCLSCVTYAVCTPNAKNFGTCICKSANGERKQTCSYHQGCLKDGTCIEHCVGELQSNCMCENPWDELTACTKEQICHSGTCLRDPELCKIVSSLKCDEDVDVENFCPIKCGNQHQPDDICSKADCDRLDSKELCPIECGVPDCPVSSEFVPPAEWVPLVDDCVCRSTNSAKPCRKGKTCQKEKGCTIKGDEGIWPLLLMFG